MSQEEENNDIDVQALLASINANFENEQLLNEAKTQVQEVHQHIENLQQGPSESIVIVRDQPIQKEQELVDPVIELLNRVEIQNSLLTNPEINQHQLETGPLQSIIQQIKEKSDKQQETIIKRQRNICCQIIDIRNLSNQLVNVQINNHGIMKMKLNDFKNKQKAIDQLDVQVFKTKGYVLSIIERLEIMEQNLDYKIDAYAKQKVQQLAIK
ncbi:unnamed protein product (macronuclear) [Paramecium tetraurelia]|uniref:Uncharacterized protein n=1 Tax=Paramecium tetraurelia TaxID=5888 RepID=A0CK64_PARTE|nr:uncharacterized protein GSPATT00000894001 [Paramecium tetraurelia]CAK71181.1 unnamed protein product [Paramecium tetraurelia]|eukprot:XP_001438578.1 hypothetical protein (macronuclear) [Paramecium tetraurelia strain d4-2]